MRETRAGEGRGHRRCRCTRSRVARRSARTTASSAARCRPGAPVRLQADQHRQRPARFRLSGMTPVRRRDRRRRDRHRLPCRRARRSRSAPAAATTSAFRHAERSRIRRGRRLEGRARVQPGRNGEPGRGPFTARVRPGARAPERTPARLGSRFDRTFQLEISKKVGFLDGRPGRHWALNGRLYPRVPMFEVAKGDLVRIDLANDSSGSPPDAPARSPRPRPLAQRQGGRPWSTDTLEMLPHERYSVAFRANNPGLWMLHCHNLEHAADGLTHAPHVRRRDDAVPGREVSAQRSRVATRPVSRPSARPRRDPYGPSTPIRGRAEEARG